MRINSTIRKYLFFLLIAFLFSESSSIGQTPNFGWAKSMGALPEDRGSSIAVDAFHNVYTTGYFNSTVDFDPGSGSDSLTSIGTNNIFIQKLDSSGNFIWAKSIAANSNYIGNGITVDGAGDVYISGTFSGSIDFDPDTAATFSLSSNGGSDIFILKLYSNGNFAWAKSVGSSYEDNGVAICADHGNNVLITGYYSGQIDFDPNGGSQIFNPYAADDEDIFILKLSSSGNYLWAKTFGGYSDDDGNAITVDAADNVYSTGHFKSSVNFDPNGGTDMHYCNGSVDIYIQKLDSAGNFIWAKTVGAILVDEGMSITVDGSGNVYTAGFFRDTVDFDPSINSFDLISSGTLADIFILKLNASGDFVWAKSMGGPGDDKGFAINSDTLGNIYTSGFFNGNSGPVDFDPNPGETDLATAGGWDVFIQKLNPTGELVWATSLGGTSLDVCKAMTIDNSQNIYLTGYFQGTSDFDPTTSVFNLTAPTGTPDVFVVKLSDHVTGISELNFQQHIFVFPNPCTNAVNLQSNGIAIKTVSVLNLLGEEIMYFDNTKYCSTNFIINLSGMASGIYFLKAYDGTNQYCGKLMVE